MALYRSYVPTTPISGFEHLGIIPFDLDVVDSYGTREFWGKVFGTNFFLQLGRVWNNLAKWEGLQQIPEQQVKGVGVITTASSLGQYSLRERVTFIMGAFITFGAFLLGATMLMSGRRLDASNFAFILISGLCGVILMTGHLIIPKRYFATKAWSEDKIKKSTKENLK